MDSETLWLVYWLLIGAVWGYILGSVAYWVWPEVRSWAWCRLERIRARRDPHDAVRRHLAAFGVDVSDFTDEELEKGIEQVATVSLGVGISTEEASQALTSVLASEQA